MKRICKQCGAEFTLSQEEIAFYRSKNLHLPKRCENCRRENKAKAGKEAVQQVVRPYHEKRNSGIKWWVAAAVVCALLAVGIGAFRGGWPSEKAQPDAADEVSPEAAENVSTAAGVEAESPSAMPPEISGTAESEDTLADTEPDTQLEMSKESEDVLADTEPDMQIETSKAAEDTPADAPQKTPEDAQSSKTATPAYQYSFRKAEYLQEHFDKHGAEFGYATADEYLAGANRVVASPGALHKLEAEDGDDVYYLESTNEFVIVSTDGYLRTYFKPDDGKAYFDRQ